MSKLGHVCFDCLIVTKKSRFFSLLTLFHLSKKHVIITCTKILLNVIEKITPGYKV